MKSLLLLNGEIVPLEQGRIDIEDRGFQFADGIYETVRCYNGKPFRLDLHLERLERNTGELEIDLPTPTEVFHGQLQRMLSQSEVDKAVLYIQVTRGVAPRLHSFPTVPTPTMLAYVRGFTPLSEEVYENGVVVVTAPDNRWERCDIKTICLLPNVLVKERARKAGAFEAFYLSPENIVYEGATSNAFCFKDGELFTHPLSNKILAGVTRQVLLELASKIGIPVREEPKSLQDFLQADEVFLASSTREVIGVNRIDNVPIGDGKTGALTRKLHQAYQESVRNWCE